MQFENVACTEGVKKSIKPTNLEIKHWREGDTGE